jgi:hypothetical protein
MNETATNPLDTQVEGCREGEYQMVADSVDFEAIQGKKDPSKTYPRLTIQWNILDEAEKARLGRDKVTCRQQFLLDVNESGRLDWGKGRNVRLGQIFDAMGMNDGTGSIGRIMGGPMVRGRVVVNSNPNDPERKYSEVVRVAKL